MFHSPFAGRIPDVEFLDDFFVGIFLSVVVVQKVQYPLGQLGWVQPIISLTGILVAFSWFFSAHKNFLINNLQVLTCWLKFQAYAWGDVLI